jgi:ABC-2 type transport system ATP-binding protein
MTPIVLKNISKSYGKAEVLKDVSLTLKAGEILGLIGPSGSGKTTLVKTIMGMEKPSGGNVEVLNKTMPNLEVLQNLGYMAQSDALYNDLSAKDNLIFFANLFKISKKEIPARIEYVSNLVNLSSQLNKKVSAYSGGMKRRLSLAISLIQDPPLLILDEPTVGIDPVLRLSIWEELLDLKAKGKSIIVTTHVMDEAEKCDRLALIREGIIIAQGSPSELKSDYKVNTIEEVFLKAGRD